MNRGESCAAIILVCSRLELRLLIMINHHRSVKRNTHIWVGGSFFKGGKLLMSGLLASRRLTCQIAEMLSDGSESCSCFPTKRR